MSEVIQPADVRIDSASQLMLRALFEEGESDEWVRALYLRRAADLSENRQVFYRMERYLIPAGLVEEQPRESSEDLRQFRLTTRGKQWVEEHAAEVFTPATREEIREYAREGYDAGTSAKQSVQNYRKKLNRVKTRVDGMSDDVASIANQQEVDDTAITSLWSRTSDTRQQANRNTDRIETLEADATEWTTSERVDGLGEELTSVERRLRTLEAKQAGVARQQGETERARVQLRRWAQPARYLVIGAAVLYLIAFIGTVIIAPDLVIGVVFAGIGALLGVAVGIAATIYAREATSLV